MTPLLHPGLYRVVTSYLCAGFVVGKSRKIEKCAPILRKKIEYWCTIAKHIGD